MHCCSYVRRVDEILIDQICVRYYYKCGGKTKDKIVLTLLCTSVGLALGIYYQNYCFPVVVVLLAKF